MPNACRSIRIYPPTYLHWLHIFLKNIYNFILNTYLRWCLKSRPASLESRFGGLIPFPSLFKLLIFNRWNENSMQGTQSSCGQGELDNFYSGAIWTIHHCWMDGLKKCFVEIKNREWGCTRMYITWNSGHCQLITWSKSQSLYCLHERAHKKMIQVSRVQLITRTRYEITGNICRHATFEW